LKPVEALLFDLYGTLLHVTDAGFQRGLAKLVRAPRGRWSEVLREVLLVQPFPDRDAFVRAALSGLAAEDQSSLVAAARELLDRELGSVVPEKSLRSVLAFWRRRGQRLGLLTNSGSPFREPYLALGLAELFDAAVFSCDVGRKKPDPAIFLQLLAALGVAPGAALMIGDSLANDVVAPEALGIRAWLIGSAADRPTIASFDELAWLYLGADGEVAKLLNDAMAVRLGARTGVLRALELLPDSSQGRYNLVAVADFVVDLDGSTERVFLKRFRHPEAVWIEETMHRLLALVGIATCEIAILPGREPVLLSAPAPGTKLGSAVDPDPELAFEIGRHGASAYLFANADLRPRNSFLHRGEGGVQLTMLDYEFSLFSPAIDLSSEPGRFDPHALGRLGEAVLRERIKSRVVSAGAIKRTRRAFFDHKVATPAALDAFRAGWLDVHHAAQRAVGAIGDLLRERGAREPYLIIGTEAYRRAFLPLDVQDILERIAGDADAACTSSL
jgi:putative hydrolase of the HAD superfamily